MKILHICNDYTGSSVYEELYSRMDSEGISQIIYTPIRNDIEEGKRKINFQNQESEIIYSNIFKKYYRILFNLKTKKIFEDIDRNIELEKIDIICATTLFSDGAVALKIKQTYNIPYIVFVRMTDVYFFMKYAWHLKNISKHILINADKIIFLSPSLKIKLLNYSSYRKIRDIIEQKSSVIPNGINDYWIRNYKLKKDIQNYSLLYVGNFTKNKNVLNLIKAVLILKSEFPNLILNLVGEKGGHAKLIMKQVHLHPDTIIYNGQVSDKSKLMEFYNKASIFTMISHNETFGLVYIEALSQGLPILGTKDQGVYGVYSENIGEFVVSNSIDSIIFGLRNLINNYSTYEIPTNRIIKNHDWNFISSNISSILKDIRLSTLK